MHYSKLMIIAFIGYASGRAILLENPSSPSKRNEDALDVKRGVDIVYTKRYDGDKKRDDDITKRDDYLPDYKRSVAIADTKSLTDNVPVEVKRDNGLAGLTLNGENVVVKREEDITKRDNDIAYAKRANEASELVAQILALLELLEEEI